MIHNDNDNNGEQKALVPGSQNSSKNSQTNNNHYHSLNKNKDYCDGNNDSDENDPVVAATAAAVNNNHYLDLWTITCIVSTAFAYGCILTTLFIITLPVECVRIERASSSSGGHAIPKSVSLAMFVSIAGVTQLISPFIGILSDNYDVDDDSSSSSSNGNRNGYSNSTNSSDSGKRLPYHIIGSAITVVGLVGQMIGSDYQYWILYSVGFVFHMIGINIMYAMMLVMIPDEVPQEQTGITNGTLALLLVIGSLFGFSSFHSVLHQNIQSMYALYTCMILLASVLTAKYLPRTTKGAKKTPMQTTLSSPEEKQKQNEKQPTTTTTQQLQKHYSYSGLLLLYNNLCRSLRAMFVQPLQKLNCEKLCKSYTIDIEQNFDFFIVTVSRLFYYCGISVQTFFMYFLHDIIHLSNHDATASSSGSSKLTAEKAVALLAILGQCSGAVTCYPVGYMSDKLLHGKRKPFIYLACIMLSMVTFVLIFAETIDYMYICCAVLGAANGIYLTMETSLAVDTLNKCTHQNQGAAKTTTTTTTTSANGAIQQQSDDDNIENDNQNTSNNDNKEDNNHAQLLGIWGVAAFLGSAVGPMIAGPLLYLLGGRGMTIIAVDDDDYYNTTESDKHDSDDYGYTLPGYAAILSLSSVYFLCSALSLKFLKNND